jgi:hypothetical protein
MQLQNFKTYTAFFYNNEKPKCQNGYKQIISHGIDGPHFRGCLKKTVLVLITGPGVDKMRCAAYDGLSA